MDCFDRPSTENTSSSADATVLQVSSASYSLHLTSNEVSKMWVSICGPQHGFRRSFWSCVHQPNQPLIKNTKHTHPEVSCWQPPNWVASFWFPRLPSHACGWLFKKTRKHHTTVRGQPSNLLLHTSLYTRVAGDVKARSILMGSSGILNCRKVFLLGTFFSCLNMAFVLCSLNNTSSLNNHFF